MHLGRLPMQHWAACGELCGEVRWAVDRCTPPTVPGSWAAVVGQLLAAGAPVDAIDCEGETPL